MPEKEQTKQNSNIIARPPVAVVLGHVDHGKTAILDYIRKSNVVEKESGGITQHIGAYEVERQGKKITFLDTPGHEAFSAMRQRGARVADIAVLVVDAGEGVKEQTKEAIKFIKKANVPTVVALNKIDKPEAQLEKTKKELANNEVILESLGGEVPSVNVSAKTGEGIDELLETILLVAEMEELKADISGAGEGTVIESSVDPKKGPLATLILERGFLEEGDFLATSSTLGKAKSISDFQGKTIKRAFPSQPIVILGLEKPPGVGERCKVFRTKEEAQAFAGKIEREYRRPQVIEVEEETKVLNIILKSDVWGSCEAIDGILRNLPQEKVVLRVLKSEIGDINVGDIKLAESGKAEIFGFRVQLDDKAKLFAKQRGVETKLFEVIYELVQEVRKSMLAVLAPETKRIDLGKFKITHLFKKSRESQIVGGRVIEGDITLNTKAEIFREEEKLGEGRIKGLQKEKQNIGKASKGEQIGIMFRGDVKLEENDVLHVFREEKKKGTL